MNYFSETPTYIWVIFAFTALLVAFFVWAKFFFSDDNQRKIARDKVEKFFSFLFDYGFKIDTVDYSPNANGAWAVVMKSNKCKVRIIQDRNDIYCEVIPTWISDKKYVDISSIIANSENKDKNLFYPKARRNIDIQLEFYGKLFYSHYDQVNTFIDNYPKPFSIATNNI